jgi:subtilase family serine protease
VAAATSLAGLAFAVACGDSTTAPPAAAGGTDGCIDKDNDGYGLGCWAGADCDDRNPQVTVCGTVARCDVNAYAPGCACATDGATHECGKVSRRSETLLVCGYGSVRCSGGAWTDCEIDPKRSGILSASKPATLTAQRLLALGAPTPCTSNPCDPYCQLYRDTADPSILKDGGRGGPVGALDFIDASMTLHASNSYPSPGPLPDGAPPPAAPPIPTLPDLVVTSIVCPPTVERGGTLTCTVTIDNTGDTFAPVFANDLRLSTDATITGADLYLDFCGVASLGGHGTVTLTCSGTVPSATANGPYDAGLIADTSATVLESNEGNNTGSTLVTVIDPTIPPPPPPPPIADLVVTAITCTTPVNAQGTLSCDVTVQNAGGTFAPVFSNGFYLSTDGTIDSGDIALGDCDVSTLAPGASATVTCSGTVPATTAPGPYTAGVIVDTGSTVTESDEFNNNTPGAAVTIGATPPPPSAPDLTVTSVTCAPGTFAAGGTVSCSVTLANSGGTWAPNFTNDLRLSTDAIIDGTDTLLGSCSAPALGIGGTITVTCSGTVSLVTAPGPFFVGVVADSGNTVAESNEGNNTSSVAVTVTATPAPAAPPDISVTTVACQPSVTQAGTLSCSVTLTNSGGYWTGPFTNELRLSTDTTIDGADALLGSCNSDGILAASTVTLTCTATVPLVTAPGTWYAGFIADVGNAVQESNEGNNKGSSAFTVAAPTAAAAPPDLTVTAVSCPASVAQGGTLACAVTFQNLGGVAASGFADDLRLSADGIIDAADALLAGCGVSYLAAGATTVVTCSATIPVATAIGGWRAGVIADSGSVVLESNEANNTASTPFTVTVLPPPGTQADITVTSVTCGAASYQAGSTASCTVVLANPGGVWTGPFTNELRLSTDAVITGADTLLGNCAVTGLNPAGGSATVTCTGTISLVTGPGTYYVGLIADSGNAVVEGVPGEANNTGVSTAITVTAPAVAATPPDIRVTAITCPASVNRTEVLPCSVTFQNSGGTDAGTFTSDLRLSTDAVINAADTLLTSSCGVSYLAAGASATVSCAATVPNAIVAGPYFAGIIADSGSAILESNEANNTGSVAVTIANAAGSVTPADLQVTALTCAPGTFQSGSTLSCQVTVQNTGGTWAGGFAYLLVLSTDGTILSPPDIPVATCTIPFLAVAGSTTVTCAGTIPPATAAGSWEAGVFADSGNIIAEADETNNTRSTGVTVTAPPVAPTPPDIQATVVDCSASLPIVQGGTLACKVTFNNNGGSAAGAFTSQLVLSPDATADPADLVLGTCGLGGLAAGASVITTCSGIVAPATAPVGWFAGVIADSGVAPGAVLESNEANNTRTSAFTLNAAPGAATADLQVTSVANCALVPTSTPSSELSCDVTFLNAGTLSVGPFTNQFVLAAAATPAGVLAGTLLGTCGVASLAAGASTVVKCSGTVPALTAPATYYAGAFADAAGPGVGVGGSIVESNEGNQTNALVAGLVLAAPPPSPAPDLVVTSVTCPATQAGSTVSCSVVVTNQGGSWAAAFSNTIWFSTNAGPAPAVPDVSIGTCTSTGLAGGASATLTCVGTVPAATPVSGPLYYIKAVADSGGAVVEASEANNNTSGSFTVTAAQPPASADLIVQDVSCSTASFSSGGALSCTLKIFNQGAGAAGAFTNALRISTNGLIDASDLLVTTCGVAGLAANASTTVTCAGTVPAGTTDTVQFAQPAPAGSIAVTVGSTAGFLPGMTVLVGGSAATKTAASFAQPAVSANVLVTVGSTIGFVAGQRVYVAGGGTYTVASIPNGTQLQLTNLGLAGNAAPAVAVGANSLVTAGSYYTVASVGSATSVTLTRTAAATNIPTGLAVPVGQPIALSGFYYVGGIADSGTSPLWTGVITESDDTNNTGLSFASAGPSTAFVLPPGTSTVPQATNPPLTTQTNTIEVFFLLDVSGSMGTALSNLRTSMVGVMNKIVAGFTTTVATVAYPSGTVVPGIPTAKFGVGHTVGFNQAPYQQNAASALYQAPLPFWYQTAPTGAAAPPVLGSPLLPVQNSLGVAATSNQVTNAILPYDTAFPCASCVSRAPNHDEPEFWTAGAFAEMYPSGGLYKSGVTTAAGSFWVPPRSLAGYTCPANTNGYPCFDNGATPITVIFSDNPSPQGPGGLYAYPHPAADAASGSVTAFASSYATVTGAPNSAPAACVDPTCGAGGTNYTEGTAVAIDPTKFARYKGLFSAATTARPAYYGGSRNFPTSYVDWNDQYAGTQARNLCATAATGGEAYFKFTLAKRSFVHFDTFGSNITDTQLYLIDRTAGHADSVNKIVDCQDYQHWIYFSGGPQGHIYKGWSPGPAAPANNAAWTAGTADRADLNSYLDAGTYTLVVTRKTGTGGSYYLAVNADPEKGAAGGIPIDPGTAPNAFPTLPTFDQMINLHKAVGGAIVGVDVSGHGPPNTDPVTHLPSPPTAFGTCTSNWKTGHRTDRWTYVTMQEAARRTGACRSDPATCQDPLSVSYWTDPYVFSTDMNGLKCKAADAALDESISTSILDLSNNNLRVDVGVRVVDSDDATDYDGAGGSPVLSPVNCDEGPNGLCDGTAWARPLGVFVDSITPATPLNPRCTRASGTTHTGCLPGTAVSYNVVYGVPAGFKQSCLDQVFKFDVEAYVKTATCTPGVDCTSLGTTTASITVPADTSLPACAPAAPPDITASIVSCNAPAAGGTLSCSVTFSNSGGVAVPAFASQLMLSSDATIATPPDTVLGTCLVGGIPGLGSTTVNCAGTVATAGSWFAGIAADWNNAVAEVSDANNTASLAVTVAAAPVAPAAADLSVQSMGCTASVAQGGTLTCTAVLQNGGGTNFGAFMNQLVLASAGTPAAVNAGTVLGNCGVSYLGVLPATATVVCSGQVPSGTSTAGPWFAGIIVNAGNLPTESSYANNTAASPLSVTATSTPKADLVVVGPTACTASVAQGGTLSCDVSVRNQGGTWAGAFTTQLVLSTDATIATPADPVLATCTSAGIAAGTTSIITCAGTVPLATSTVGPWFAGIILDSGNVISESPPAAGETNNTFSSALTVTAAPVAPTPSDIVVQTVDCSASSPVVQGGTLSCAVTFKNNGGIAAPGFTSQLVLSADATILAPPDVVLGSCGVSYLAGGATATVTCSGAVPSATAVGAWFGGVVADSGGVVMESNEANNTGSTGITVTVSVAASGADVVVTAVSCPPATFPQGATLTCDVTIQNTGGVGISSAFTNELRLSADATITAADVLLGSCGLSGLGAGASTTIKCAGVIPLATATGAWFAGVLGDSANDVPEATETNNTGSTGIAVTATSAAPTPADVIVQSVTCPASVPQGGTLACSVVFRNQGGQAAGAFANDLRLSPDAITTVGDALLTGCGVSYLAAGASATVSCSAVVPAATGIGGWYAGVIADSANLILESNEANNTGSVAFTVTVPPTATLADIQVQSVACAASVAQGANVSCTVTLANPGGTPAGAFANQLRLSTDAVIDGTDLLLGSCGAPNLAATGNVVVTCSGTVPGGTLVGAWFAGVIGDSGGAVAESNEANNTGSTPLNVTAGTAAPAPTDIVVTSVVCPAAVAQGTNLSCAVTLTNAGGSDAGIFTNDLRLSPDATITTADLLLTGCGVGFLAAGASTTVTCGGLVPAATTVSPPVWFAGVIADSGNLVLESNELNNTGSAVFSVTLPSAGPAPADIIVQAVSCPATLQAGATVSCDVTFANVGGTPATAFANELRVSADAVINAADTLIGNCGVTGLGTGATTTVKCSGVVSAGTGVGPWFAGVEADSGSLIVEGNEANNTGAAAFAVTAPATAPAAPDIVVTAMACSASVAQGGTVSCAVTFTNQGFTAASVFANQLWLSLDTTINGADALVGTCGVTDLAIGASTTVNCAGTVPVSAAVGPWYAGIVADSGNTVVEADETNNVSTAGFNVTVVPPTPPPPRSDIQITSIVCPANADQGGTLTCTVTFTNGGGTVAGAFDNELRLSTDATITNTDTLLANCGLSGLAVATPTTVTCSGMVGVSTVAGPWFAGVIGDSAGAVIELDETNNTASTPVTVVVAPPPPPPPDPDLAITAVSCPATANPGDPIACSVTVINQGASPAGASTVELRWSVDKVIGGADVVLGTCAVGALAGGASTTVACNGVVPLTATLALYYYVGAIVDSASVVTETSETNNTSYTPLLVPAPAPVYGNAWYERDYDGTGICPSGYRPVWGLFSWDSKTPGDSHITFSVQTANTQAGLAAAPSDVMAVAASANPPGYGGSIYPATSGTADTQVATAIVNDVLAGNGRPPTSSWLRITSRLDPSVDLASTPALSTWGLLASCTATQ